MKEWPQTKLSLNERLDQATEGLWDALSAKMLSEAEEPTEEAPEAQETPAAEPEEYNGIDPLTFIQYKDGKETHFRIPI